MRILPCTGESIAEVISLLRKGAVIAHATETCYGLACDLSNIDAVKKLFAIKNRPDTQPVSALFSSVDDAKKYVMWNERAEELAQQYLPGPLTFILPMRNDAPLKLFPTSFSTLNSQFSTIGVRISSHPHACALVTAFGSPLSTTSANLHGLQNPYSAEDIVAQFAKQEYQPDLILDSGTLPVMSPSTVINLSGNNEIYRQGSVQL